MAKQYSSSSFDVIVVGGGLVGAAAALAFAKQKLQVALIEKHPPLKNNYQQENMAFDNRIYAISPQNQQLLDSLGAWPAQLGRIQAVDGMSVWGDAGGAIELKDESVYRTPMAYIAENALLAQALWTEIEQTPAITLFLERSPQSIETTPLAVSLVLDQDETLTAQLLVGADGAKSWVGQHMGLTYHSRPYKTDAFVANYACELPHRNIARQWFQDGEIMAWLPLPNQQISIVYASAHAQSIQAQSVEARCAAIAQFGHNTLGKLEEISTGTVFPLKLSYPEKSIAARIVLVGDAAHTVHPLAGQGVNLGLQDVAVLASLALRETDIGNHLMLRQYQRERLEAVRTMQYACDGLYHLFAAKSSWVSWLRNTGLNLTNQATLIKKQLIKHAMGV